jgi:TonB family protein
MDSANASESSVSIPVGNTVQVDPSRSAPRGQSVTQLPAGSGARSPGPLSLRSLPEINTDACGRSAAYPKEAQNLGIEGDVKLRITLDERGAVQEVRVLSGLGHGLDREAVNAIRLKCKFTPAIGGDGRPVPYVIDPYVFHFEIPR